MNIYCVRAEFGTYTQHFLDGGYAAIGWLPETDLSRFLGRLPQGNFFWYSA